VNIVLNISLNTIHYKLILNKNCFETDSRNQRRQFGGGIQSTFGGVIRSTFGSRTNVISLAEVYFFLQRINFISFSEYISSRNKPITRSGDVLEKRMRS
jgi:hypothetical protein